jgi:two-component system response regulator GlrR
MIGASEPHRQLCATIEKVAQTNAEILITGPSGVGKELYARYVHERSRRADRAFVPVNCGALPAELFENELYGHGPGAYTGASGRSDGLVAEAEGGTLFLDEVDALAPQNQVKLLRLIQAKEYRRLGEPRIRRADVRVVAATNADLVGAVRAGQFREDLFFRLRVVPLVVPPLRERADDIEPLLDAFADTYAGQYGLPRIVVSDPALARLRAYEWPGNIRELENCVRYLTCLQLARPVQVADLPLVALKPKGKVCVGEFRKVKSEVVAEFEREYLRRALEESGGNIAQAARAAGKPRRAFFELMSKHDVVVPRS